MLENFLKKIKVLQVVSNEERHRNGLDRLGRGFFEAQRFNPYNPLSYFVVLIMYIIILIVFGLNGLFGKSKTSKNPFKWD